MTMKAACLCLLALAMILGIVGFVLVCVGYAPATGFGHNSQHELIMGMIAGAISGIVVSVSILSVFR
jgi:zinc transporter ZupT